MLATTFKIRHHRSAATVQPDQVRRRDLWLGLAKKSGVKYLVIRSKHHGGFAIYDSAVSDYDIVDAPPEERDFDRYLNKGCG